MNDSPWGPPTGPATEHPLHTHFGLLHTIMGADGIPHDVRLWHFPCGHIFCEVLS